MDLSAARLDQLNEQLTARELETIHLLTEVEYSEREN